jgi:hypothetical protein
MKFGIGDLYEYYHLLTGFIFRSSSLLALQPCVSLDLHHGFVNSNFFWVVSLAPCPNPNLEDQELHFVWPLPLHLSGVGGSTRSLRSRQHS